MSKEKLMSMAPPNLAHATQQSIHDYFENTWMLSDVLYNSVNESALYLQTDPLRHPLIFYIGHIATFYVNILKKTHLLDSGINKSFETLFAAGIDPERIEDYPTGIEWPQYQSVIDFRASVYQLVSNIISKSRFTDLTLDSPLWGLLMAIDHERIHFETSSVLIRQYPVQFLRKSNRWTYADITQESASQKMIDLGGGEILLGKPEGYPYFGWDNESGFSLEKIKPFKASQCLISNIEFMEFVKDNGYSKEILWSAEGWAWVKETKTTHPKFWIQSDNCYQYRAMYDVIELPLNWPVEVNFHEVAAFCRWKGNGTRPITEGEFEHIASYRKTASEPFESKDFNINFKYGSPQSVFLSITQDQPFGDIYGNVFQWLSTDFYPLIGFRPHYLYPHFSYPYFGSKHAMMKGGSWASTGASASKYYRLWFRKCFFQHAGFRIAQSL